VRRWICCLVLAGCAGSWSTSFHPRDPTWQARASAAPVDVYLYSPPARPYQAVGLIEVDPPSGKPAPMQELVDRALVKAHEVGCELLVIRNMHHGALRRPVLVAQRIDTSGIPPGETLGAAERSPRRGQFVCGVYSPPG
jgi:hypothetical protein